MSIKPIFFIRGNHKYFLYRCWVICNLS